jgi:hypothetical protein
VPIRPYSIMNCRSSPWICGQVCRQWRTVVESLSSLWNKIDLDWAQVRKCQHSADILQTVLRRTNSSPLYIYIISNHDEYSDDERVQLVEPILSTVNRWYELRIDLPLDDDSWWTTQLKILAASPFPALRCLCISQNANFLPDAALDIFRSATSIQKYYTYMPYQYGPEHDPATRLYRPRLPWTGLTHFGWEVPSMDPEIYCDLFRNLPNLVDVELHGYEADQNSDLEQRIAALPVITLPQVHTLHVFSFDFLPVLCLPALETIAIMEESETYPSISFGKFESCVLQSKCSVKSLLLSYLYDKTDIYLRSCSSSLTTLDIDTASRSYFNNFVSALTIDTEASSIPHVVLPNLETLSIRYREDSDLFYEEDINIDGVAQMVELRWKVVHPAVRQLVSFYHLLEEERSPLEDQLRAHPTIKQLKEEGLNVALLRERRVCSSV